MAMLGMYSEAEVTEFASRFCVGCEGENGIKDDAKISWFDQLEE